MQNLSISQVLDRIRSRHNLKSDYAVSKLLDSSTQLIANWRHGRALPDERRCQKLAELAGLDADVLIAQMNAQRAKDDDSRAIWQRIAERLQMVPQALAAAAFAVLFATSFVATDAHAQGAQQTAAAFSANDSSIHRIY